MSNPTEVLPGLKLASPDKLFHWSGVAKGSPDLPGFNGFDGNQGLLVVLLELEALGAGLPAMPPRGLA